MLIRDIDNKNKSALLGYLNERESNNQSNNYNDSNKTDIPHEIAQKLLLVKRRKDNALRYRSQNNIEKYKKDINRNQMKENESNKEDDENAKNELKLKELKLIKINQDINNILSNERLFSDQNQSILDEFREKIESLKAFSKEEYNAYLAENFAFIQEEIEQIKQARDHELRINMFVKSLNKSQSRIIEMKKIKASTIKILDSY